MKTLLAIIAHPNDNDRLARHWPYFKMTDCDILGCGPAEGQCVSWPEYVNCLNTGKLGKRDTPAGSSIFGLVEQELDIWRHFLTTDYDALSVVEADNVFVRKPPEHPGGGIYLVTTIPNYSPPGIFKTPVYFSTPRFGDRRCIEQLHAHGRHMFARGDVEHWISDRFPALVCHQGKIPWLSQPAWSPSPFAWGGSYDEVWLRDSRAAIATGAYCLHSVKTEWQLKAVETAMLDYNLELPLTNA